MDDKILQWLAVSLGMVGLVLLYFAPHAASDRYQLEGTVVSKHGHTLTMNATVQLVSKGGKVGDSVSTPAFWDGEKFIAVSEEAS